MQHIAAYHGTTGVLVTQSLPATPGESLTLYGIGFGSINQGAFAGRIAIGLSTLTNVFNISIGGLPTVILYEGLAPDLVGVYQFNIVLPVSLPDGDLPIQLTINGTGFNFNGQSLYLSVKPLFEIDLGYARLLFILSCTSHKGSFTTPTDFRF